MSEQRLQLSDIERFAYGEADELESLIFDDAEYLSMLEEIWASELPGDLRTPVMRAIQLERFVSGTLGLALDTAIGMSQGLLHYLAASADDAPDENDDRA
jgi:hypothetical protein